MWSVWFKTRLFELIIKNTNYHLIMNYEGWGKGDLGVGSSIIHEQE